MALSLISFTAALGGCAPHHPSHHHSDKGGGGFEKDDANSDGKVTREEFSGPEDLFDKLDSDGDGVITKEEAKPKDCGSHDGPPPPKS